MSTESKILANRQNASKSTGPKSPHGKSLVSKNALKHGFTAIADVIRSENLPEFELFRDAILSELAPQTPVETVLAQRFVSLSWRLKRIALIQNRAIDTLNKDNTPSPLEKLYQSLLSTSLPAVAKAKAGLQTPPDISEEDPNLALGRLAVKDFSNGRVLERLLMYERRIENSLYKTLLELQRLNLLKSMKS